MKLLSSCRKPKRHIRDSEQPPLSGYAKWTHRLQEEAVAEREKEESGALRIPAVGELRLGEYMALDGDPKEVLPETVEARKQRQLDAIAHYIRVSSQQTSHSVA